MNMKTFEDWLSAYGRAWEARDPHAAALLFTFDATYQETPFDEPMRGRKAIYSYWSEVPLGQEQVKFQSQALAVTGNRGIARWRASFIRVPSKVEVRLDGIFVAKLNEEGLCTEFQEWWHRREQESERVDSLA